jgi:hypothetical protein
MRESRTSGSARGARSNPRPYRDPTDGIEDERICNGSAAAGAECACVPGRLVFEAGKLALALGHAETATPTADIHRIGGAMRAPAGPRMVVPRPECWNVDLDPHLAAQTLPCGDAGWRLAERLHRNPAHVTLREDYSVPQENVLSATAARTAQLYISGHHGGELSPEVGDGSNREGGISWGCLTTSLLHRTKTN